MDKGTCSVAGCGKPIRSFTWCSAHYYRWRRTGNPLPPPLPPDLPGENWLPVPGYEGLYDVSDLGRVRSLPRNTTSGKILKFGWHAHGYPQVTLWRDGKGWHPCIHQIVTLAFLGPRPDGLEVRHLDDDPLNNTLANLVYGTRSENKLDTVRLGTHYEANKTHCKYGHEYTAENTYRAPGTPNKRHCRTCIAHQVKEWKTRNKMS